MAPLLVSNQTRLECGAMEYSIPFASSRHAAAAGILLLGALWLSVPVATAQEGGAGDMSNQRHQHAPPRDQALRDAADEDEVSDSRARAVQAGPGDRRIDEHALKADMQAIIERRRRELLPEYERRVRTDGRQQADAWLRARAAELGRRDGEAIRAKYSN